jgi:hypothetical protein
MTADSDMGLSLLGNEYVNTFPPERILPQQYKNRFRLFSTRSVARRTCFVVKGKYALKLLAL